MNPTDADHWKSEVLDEIFIALAASNEIDQALVFKGARVLSLRLGGRPSVPGLDANLTCRTGTGSTPIATHKRVPRRTK